jgi:hypothetical protein
VIPYLVARAESLGIGAVFALLVIAGLFTLLVLLLQSIARLFDDRES